MPNPSPFPSGTSETDQVLKEEKLSIRLIVIALMIFWILLAAVGPGKLREKVHYGQPHGSVQIVINGNSLSQAGQSSTFAIAAKSKATRSTATLVE